MIDPRIHRALAVAGVFLLVGYGAGLAWFATTHRLARPTDPAPAIGDGPDATRAYYRVRAANGETHVIDANPLDPGGALLTATERFGEGVTLERIDPSEVPRALDETASGELGPALFLGLPLLLLPLWSLLAAAQQRRRYQRLHGIWQRVRPRLGYPAQRIIEEVGLGPGALSTLLTNLNEHLHTELIWDQQSGQIVDARLSHFTLVLNHCPRCNADIHARVRADLLSPPRCQSCMLPFEGQELEHQREKIVARLLEDDPRRPQRASRRRFSLAYFALWVLVFPPIAIVYALASAR